MTRDFPGFSMDPGEASSMLGTVLQYTLIGWTGIVAIGVKMKSTKVVGAPVATVAAPPALSLGLRQLLNIPGEHNDSEAPTEQGDTSDHDSTASSPEQRPPHTAEVQQQSRCSSSEPPHDLTCPITCALLVDPVITVADGETYERAAIEAWFGEGHDTSPITGERLDNSALVPNNAMKRLIVQWQDCEALSRAFAFFA